MAVGNICRRRPTFFNFKKRLTSSLGTASSASSFGRRLALATGSVRRSLASTLGDEEEEEAAAEEAAAAAASGFFFFFNDEGDGIGKMRFEVWGRPVWASLSLFFSPWRPPLLLHGETKERTFRSSRPLPPPELRAHRDPLRNRSHGSNEREKESKEGGRKANRSSRLPLRPSNLIPPLLPSFPFPFPFLSPK